MKHLVTLMKDLDVVWNIILKWIFRKWDGEHGLNLSGSRQEQVAGTCQCGDELSGFIKCRGFLDQLRNCQLLQKDTIPWSQCDYAVSNVRAAVNSRLRRTCNRAVTDEVKQPTGHYRGEARKNTKHLGQESRCLRKYSNRKHVENKAEALAVGLACLATGPTYLTVGPTCLAVGPTC